MSDQVIGVTIKGIGDFSDVVSNVGSVQKALTKLKLPDKLGDNLNKNITNFYKEYEKYQKKIAEGIHTQGDQNAVNKSLNSMLNSYEKIIKDFGKISSKDFKDIFNLDEGQFASVQKRIKDIEANIKKIKLDPKQLTEPLKVFQDATKAKSLFGNGKGFDRLDQAFKNNNLEEAKQAIIEIDNYLTRFGSRMDSTKFESLKSAFAPLKQHVLDSDNAAKVFTTDIDKLNNELGEIGGRGTQELNQLQNGLKGTDDAAKSVIAELKQIHANEFDFNRQAADIDRQIQSYFGLSQMIRKVGDIARDAFATVKELDAAMTQTAVVTNFSVGDMWNMLPTYTAQANQLGSTIKDVYEAATLYYQQGLNTNQAMGLANETLKMARIAGLDAAEATNMMTAALRGFNMEINQTSAQKINDIYSELAAITASDTKEIGSAMERTASIANAANMDFATTSAFLAQMIETTREAPENLGTAMKTIVARFQEMKQDPTKLVDSEGVAMDVNKVDKALKTIGVSLTNTKGEFRDLDDVFLDISAKWDSLSQGQQRYIATIAAGSRQQSRFIAMMSDYERTMELVDAANNSAGASQRQFEKTLDSMGAKLNMLKNAWDQFTMGLMNNQILKFGVDRLTDAFTIVNKFIDILGKLPPKPFEGITKSALTLATTLGMLSFGKRASRGLIMGGAGWWKGETSLAGGFAQGWKESKQPSFFSGRKGNQQFNNSVEEARKSGASGAAAYAAAWKQVLPKAGLKDTLAEAFKIDRIKENIQTNTAKGLLETLMPKEQISQEARDQFQYYMQEFQAGNIKREDMPSLISGAISEIDQIQVTDEVLDKMANMPDPTKKMGDGFGKLTSAIGSAGASLQVFGSILEGTPLEPFGQILITVGTGLTALSGILAGTKVAFFESAAAQLGLNAELEITSFSALKAAAAEAGLTVTTGALATAVWSLVWPLLAVVAVIGTVYGACKLLDAAIETNKEKLESVTDAAAAASEAYDSAKQETSELTDAIEQIKTNEDAFDGLVVGTAAFNEQLVNANEQIMELIKKYPMLMDADKNYVTTDKNGLMHISDEGLEAVKEYQKQRQANASALNLIQTADLNSEETRQKAEQMRKVKGTDTTETLKQRQQEADLLEQQAKAQADMAKVNAVNTALVDKEIHNREKVSAIMAEQYDARKNAVNLEGESIHDLKQEYADFYGYKYDKSTKKLTDVEGNEIDVDKATVKDAVKEIRVIADFEADGKSLDSMLNSIDNKFSNALGDTFAKSGNLFSDIMSDNIDIDSDLLENLITNPDKLQSAVDALSEKEIAAVLGVSANAVAEAPDKYKNELTDKLTEKATNIAETQAQSYADLASMLAQITSADVSQLIDENGQATTKAQKANQQAIKEQLDKLNTEQKNTLLFIGNALSEGAGTETMRTFIRQATDIYTKGTQESITALGSIIKDINWSSPTARLKAYNDMINSADKDVQNLGNSLRNSSESSNLLGEAFEEFYDSSDFQEMAENMDKFADSSGKLNATSIQEMAKECGSLNNLLDTGAISAGGVAAALNAMGADGNITILDLNENLLKFLSTANQLDDVLSEAHSLIENFDWGIDTGESADFATDSTKKWKELYDNGEFGNQQLENYAKFVLGQERWNKELEKSGGNIEKALDNMSGDILKYSDGFDQAWEDMASSTSEKYKDFYYADNGDLIWETNGRTTQQLVEDLAEARGITQDWAKLMVEDFANYSYDFKTELQANDFTAALKEGDYIAAHKGADNTLNMTQNELATLAASQNKTEEEILKDIQKYGKVSEDQLNVIKTMDENGNLLMGKGDIDSLNTQYSQAELGKNTAESWISKYVAKNSQGEKIENSTELKSAISGAMADGFQEEQATEMARMEAYEAFKDGTQVFYDGVELQKEDLADSQAFAEKIAEITDSSRWNAVGKAIAQGYVDFISGGKNKNKNSNDKPKSDTNNTQKEGTKYTSSVTENKTLESKTVETNEKTTKTEETNKIDKYDAEVTAFYEKQNEEWKKDKEQPTLDKEITYNAETNGVNEANKDLDGIAAKTRTPYTVVVGGDAEEAKRETEEAVQYALSQHPQIPTGADTSGAKASISSIYSGIRTLFIPIKPDFQGTWEKSIKIKKESAPAANSMTNTPTGEAKGKNNHASIAGPPSFGSAARGYGRLGPKGKGGPTLTGELGYEIAWLPSENRSMILGADGPQMIDLPGDAVVWTHEQSKKILKQKAIPMGSHAGKHPKNKDKDDSPNSDDKQTGQGKGKGKSTSVKLTNKLEITTGKINKWWDNIDRKVDKVTKSANKLGDQVTKRLNDIRASIDQVNSENEKFINKQKQVIKYNQAEYDTAQAGLSTKQYKKLSLASQSITKKTSKEKAKEIQDARKELSISRKTAKTRKKAIDSEKKVEVSWKSPKKVKSGKDKGKLVADKTVDVNKKVNLKKYIKYDEATGTYTIDTNKINADSKFTYKTKKGKTKTKTNKDKAEALSKATETYLNDMQNRKDTAKENITKAQDELANYRKEIDDAFFGWKNELTQVLRITSKIERKEAEISQNKAEQDRTEFFMDNLDLSRGKAGTNGQFDTLWSDYSKEITNNIKLNQDEIKLKNDLIEANKKEMQAAADLTDTLVTYEGIDGQTHQESERAMYERISKITENGSGTGWDELSTQEKEIFARKQLFKRGLVTGDAEKGYSLNKEALNAYEASIKNGDIQKELGELLKSTFDTLNDKTLENSKLRTEAYELETDNYKLEQQRLDKAKELAEQLYGWKNTLTQILQLTQKIEQTEKRTSLLKQADDYYTAKQKAVGGVSSTAILTASIGQMASIITQIQDRQQLLEERRQDLRDYITGADLAPEIEQFKEAFEANPSDDSVKAKLDNLIQEATYRKEAQKYVQTTPNADGTFSVVFDSKQLELDKIANGSLVGTDFYNKVEEYAQKIADKNNEIAETMAANASDITELYNSLTDLRQEYADRMKELREAYGAQQQKVINNLKSLYTSIDNNFKELINDVKQNIQRRRQQEDNVKTEQEISRKQQRLAALRANTAGGNQVAIAQLEKEIADAQQAYGRTLEDQMLDKISQQGDIAAKQRQQQIELMQAQRDWAAKTGKDAVKIERWVAGLTSGNQTIAEESKTKIQELFKDGTNWAGLTQAEQEMLSAEISSKLLSVQTLPGEIKLTNKAIALLGSNITSTEREINTSTLTALQTATKAVQDGLTTGLSSIGGNLQALGEKLNTDLDNTKETIKKVEDEMNIAINSLQSQIDAAKAAEKKAKAEQAAAEARAKAEAEAQAATEAKAKAEKDAAEAKARAEAEAQAAAKAEEEALKKAKLAAHRDTLRSYSTQLAGAQRGLDSAVASRDSNRIGVARSQLFSIQNSAQSYINSHNSTPEEKYYNFLFDRGNEVDTGSTNWGKIDKNDFKEMIGWGLNNKLTAKEIILDLIDTKALTWEEVVRAGKDYGWSTDKWKEIRNSLTNNGYKNNLGIAVNKIYGLTGSKAFKTSFKTGGFADFTGPAWLDGTPSKPELVLNAKDTQNFIALRDVLSKVLGSANSITNSYGGDTMYEININVDHLNNDYDVDKVVEKVKKEITKGAGYRNVTQVRNFR